MQDRLGVCHAACEAAANAAYVAGYKLGCTCPVVSLAPALGEDTLTSHDARGGSTLQSLYGQGYCQLCCMCGTVRSCGGGVDAGIGNARHHGMCVVTFLVGWGGLCSATLVHLGACWLWPVSTNV